ncbi:GGDEF domain-containing protein [Paraglaciecola mesophila]|nr:GGDEF domain-containing protein [Paraglaciecola mesophila]
MPSAIAAEAVAFHFSKQYDVLTQQLNSQPQQVLTQLLSSPPPSDMPVSQKAEYYAILSDTYYALTYPQKAIESARQGLSFITQQHEPWLYHNLSLIEASALEMAGKPFEALHKVDAAIGWAQENEDEKTYLLGLYVRGSLFTSLNEYNAAAESYLEAYNQTTSYTGKISKANIAGMLGVMYDNRGDYALAIPYFAEAVAHARKNDESLNLSIVLYGLGSANFRVGNVEIGEAQILESADIAKSLGDTQGVGYALKLLAEVSIKKQDYALAEQRLHEAADIFANSENKPIDFQIAKSLFVVALAQHNYQKALRYSRIAKANLDSDLMPTETIELTSLEGKLAAAQGDYQAAYEHSSQALSLSEKYHESRSAEQIHTVRAIYKVRASEQANQLLEHQNRLQRFALSAQEQRNMYLWSFIAVVLVVCCLLAVMVYRVKAQSRALVKLATTDDLTGLYNRRYIIEQLERQVIAASRYGYDLCVAIIDLDFFKKINDSYGHAVGDQVLLEFSRVCSDNLRRTDLLGRIGGEEFLVLLPHTTLQDGYDALDSLRCKVSQLRDVVGIQDLSISASVGLTSNTPNLDGMQLMANADIALYQAKTGGRDQTIIHPTSSTSVS